MVSGQSGPILNVVVLILLLVALVLISWWVISILNGDTMNATCKEATGRMFTVPLIGIKPLQPICDIIAPAGAGKTQIR
jgi:hypothetical protein